MNGNNLPPSIYTVFHIFRVQSLCISSVLLSLFLLVGGCAKKGDDPEIEQEMLGLIPLADFEASNPPTYAELMNACEIVLKNNPALESNEEKLAYEVFYTLNPTIEKKLSTTKSAAVVNYIDMMMQMNWEEWKLALFNMKRAMEAAKSVVKASNAVRENFPCENNVQFFDNSKANAIYHGYWNALMVKYISYEFSKKVGDAHESANDPSDVSTKMDLHNNEIARVIALQYPMANDEELLDLLLHQKFVYFDQKEGFDANLKSAFVYFVNRQTFDGMFTGIMTNPDINANWNISFDLTQCGNDIRGQYTIVNGATLQKRRFNGTRSGDELNLNVSSPYYFENAGEMAACLDIQLRLTGSAERLSGSWVSSNCYRGGQLTISKSL